MEQKPKLTTTTKQVNKQKVRRQKSMTVVVSEITSDMMMSSVINNKHTSIPEHGILVPPPQPKIELFCVAPVVLELTL